MYAPAATTTAPATTDPDLAACIVRDHTRLEAAAAGVRVLVPGGDVGLVDAILGAAPTADVHTDDDGRELFDAVLTTAAADDPAGWMEQLRALRHRLAAGGRLTAVLTVARDADAVAITDLVGLANDVVDHGGWVQLDGAPGRLAVWMDAQCPRRRRPAGEAPLFTTGS